MSKSNWNNIIENIYRPEQVEEFKRKFAKLLVKHENDLDRIFNEREFLILFDGDVACQLYAYNHWAYDSEVLAYKRQVIESGMEDLLPDEIEVARMIFGIAEKAHSPTDKLAALREYSKLRGFDKGADVQGAGQNVVIITDKGNGTSWEESLLKNQHELQEKGQRIADGTYQAKKP